MNYLYGDSTTSTLRSNFLELLRDAIDFSVFVLQADAKIEEGRAKIRALGEESEAESARLERFVASITHAVQIGDKGAPESPTARCADHITTLIGDAHRASLDGIRRSLADEIARVEAEEAAQREACVQALGALLAPHEPPGASTVLRLTLLETGRYGATLEAKSEPALAWTLDVAIPDDHPWAAPMRVERLEPHLEIRTPQLAGWITKEVKIRPQRIERWVVTQLVDDGQTVRIHLRAEPSSDAALELEVDPNRGVVFESKRVGPADDPSVGAFDLHAEDAPRIVELAKKLRESLDGLERPPNVSATFDGGDFRALPTFVTFVERLIAVMAPITREIARRSLTPNELVLRRLLSNDRREEIFVAKATLRDKLAPLPPKARAVFAPLELEVDDEAKPAATPSEPPELRSELPPSVPPPAVVKPSVPPPAVVKPPPPPTRRAPPLQAAAPSAVKPRAAIPPPKSAPAGSPPSPAKRTDPDAPEVEVVDEAEPSSDEARSDAAPGSTQGVDEGRADGAPRNEALVAVLKKITRLSKNGRAAEAYEEYAGLFSSDEFASYRPEEQRKALELMLLARAHPPDKDVVSSAHKAALSRLEALIDGADEPDAGDHELLGVAHLYLGDEKAASAAFQAALTAERAKGGRPELLARLMRRVSQL